MDEEWDSIPEFPGYAISSYGRLVDERSGRNMVAGKNQQGLPSFGFNKEGIQYRRSVAVLVANTFVPKPDDDMFNTPINLDGDRTNNRADNLMWRPRWFAIAYHKQFNHPHQGFIVPIRDVDTGEEFPTSWEAAIKFGLLDVKILVSVVNETSLFPTRQRFEVIDINQ